MDGCVCDCVVVLVVVCWLRSGSAQSVRLGIWPLRSSGEHCQAELAVEVRWGTSGGEHCHPKLAVEVRWRRRKAADSDIKSNIQTSPDR